MIIDFHTHLFPDKLAGGTLEKLSAIAESPYYTNGTVRGTKEKLEEWGISKAVVMHIATRVGQMQKINDFAASIQDETLLCFGTVHPDDEGAIAELHRIKQMGLKGVKLHPDYQGFFVDDEKMFPIYEAICELGLPVLFHTGFDPLSPDVVHASSKAVSAVCKKFPDMTVIAAHMGGLNRYDESLKYLVGENLYLDTSMSSRYCSKKEFAQMVKEHGTDKILFGTDLPWSTPDFELELIDELDLTFAEREQILCKNALHLLNIPEE